MQQKFSSNITREMKCVIIFAFFYWVFMTLISVDTNGVWNSIGISALILLGVLTFLYGWIGQTYLIIDNQDLRYVSFYFSRKVVDISDVKLITSSFVAGFIRFLCIVYTQNGKEKIIQVSTVNFSKETLRKFTEEMKKINSRIEIHSSITSLIE